MSFLTATPSPILSGYIKSYWTIKSCVPQATKHIQRIVPSGLPELIFYIEKKPETSTPNKTITDFTVLSGQQKSFYDIIVTDKLSVFSVIFQPHGLVEFLNIPLSEIYNQNVPLRCILKNEVVALEMKISEAASFSKRVEIIETFLLKRLKKIKKQYEFQRIKQSIELINQTRGKIGISRLASGACLSRKQYERTFLSVVGTSPKQFLKIVRFQNAIYQKHRNRHLQLTGLAYDCGYYDQSHMINDFKSLSGLTPGQYFAGCDPYSDYFQ